MLGLGGLVEMQEEKEMAYDLGYTDGRNGKPKFANFNKKGKPDSVCRWYDEGYKDGQRNFEKATRAQGQDVASKPRS